MRKGIIILDGMFVFLIIGLLLPIPLHAVLSEYKWFNEFYCYYLYPSLFFDLAFELVMLIITIITVVITMIGAKKYKEKRVYSHVKTQMIVRLIQIPVYVCIFILAAMCLLTVFTFAITIVFAIIDLISIITTGICSIGVYSEMRKKGMINGVEQFFYTIFGFVYCLDVVVAIIAFIRAYQFKRIHGLDFDEVLIEYD